MNPEFENRILQMIREIISVRLDGSSLELDTPLLGGPVAMDELDYVYIIARIMNTFGINFAPEDFDLYNLNTASAMAACIRRHLEK